MTNLPIGTIANYKGMWGRVMGRHLNPNVKPELQRIKYSFERAYIGSDGKMKFGVHQTMTVFAAALTILE